MKNALSRYAVSCFSLCCLGCAFVALSLLTAAASPAFGQDIVINSPVPSGSNVHGNGQWPNGAAPFNGDPNNNTVTVNNNGRVNGGVYGARSSIAGMAVTGNSVFINDGSAIGYVRGGYSGGNGNATGNSVNISGGSVTQDVRGGWSGSATDNIVTISGGSVGGDVIGGYVTSGAGSATHNTVTLSGSPSLASSWLYGGATSTGTGDLFTGNTLNVQGVSNVRVASIQNFQNYNFLSAFVPGATLIQSTNPVNLGQISPVDGSGVKVALSSGNLPGGGGQRFYPGQSMTLINNTIGTPASMSLTNPIVRQGIAMLYTFTLGLNAAGNALIATASSARAAAETKSLSEGRAAALAFTNQGADHAAGKGMQAAYDSLNLPGTHWGAFVSVDGGYSTIILARMQICAARP